jgi:membrane protease YdiL (CAAX protease family)
MMLFFIQMGLTLGAFLLLHFVIGSYSHQLPRSENRRREIWEALALWAALVIAITIAVVIIPQSQFIKPTFSVVVLTNLALSPFWILIPLIVVFRMNKWTVKDLGFRRPKSRLVLIFSIGVMALIGIPVLFEPDFKPLPLWILLMSLYQPAFTEEFFFRGVIQNKLERALGQNKAWLYSGILFGLMHASVNFFGQQWYRHGENITNALILLGVQILFGWIFGIIYMKSRSLLPGYIAHYFLDGRLASIIFYLGAAFS